MPLSGAQVIRECQSTLKDKAALDWALGRLWSVSKADDVTTATPTVQMPPPMDGAQ